MKNIIASRLRNDEKQKSESNRNSKKLTWIFRGILVVILIFVLCGLDQRVHVINYEIESEKIDQQVRIALITDLHSCKYGQNMENLISLLDEQKADVVFLGGDIFDDVLSDDNTTVFLSDISKKYPCYYVTGNHECWADISAFTEKMKVLDSLNIPVLAGDVATLEINGQMIFLGGVDDPDICLLPRINGRMDSYSEELVLVQKNMKEMQEVHSGKAYTILLSHRPELYSQYQNRGFDLVLTGHAHGGQWRIPGILNGLYAPNQGLFPKYAGGLYDDESTIMINSRGLARESTKMFRLYNRPELVIIDLK